MTLYKKMMLGFGAIIMIMIISSSYVLYELKTVSNGAKHILNTNVRTQELARQLQDMIQDENGYSEKYLVSKDDAYFSLFVETSKQVSLNLKLLRGKQSLVQDRMLVHDMLKAHNELVTDMQEKKKSLPGPVDAQGLGREGKSRFLFESLDILINRNQAVIEDQMGQIESIAARSVKVALLLIAGTLITAIATAFIITRTITRPIQELIRGTQQIARGKFETVHVSSNDEILLLADAVNDMSARINDTNELRTKTMQQIAHELKTPLQAIQSAHDALQASGAVREDKRRMLEIICGCVTRMVGFIQQYLDLAKLESGVLHYNMELSDLFDIVEPIVEEAKLIAGSKRITLEFQAAPTPKVILDAEKVSIIISNLVSNAIKYTPEQGTVVVTLSPGDIGAQVEVQDSGIGIGQDELSNVFVRFYQASNRKQANTNGSGVGLAIVKAYAEGHGGRVHVESDLDQGSVFKVAFPLADKKALGNCQNPGLS